MSHCTTSTSTYILDKYSKSYPTFGEGSSEWQHFNNPVIRLTLDVTKAPNEELQSVRVRIIWTMNSGDANSTTEVVLVRKNIVVNGLCLLLIPFQEDLDLLSFSSPPSRKQQAQGLPLKAVYRDSVVGIRYLHPRDSDSNPVSLLFLHYSLPIQTGTSHSYRHIDDFKLPLRHLLLFPSSLALLERYALAKLIRLTTPKLVPVPFRRVISHPSLKCILPT